MITKRRLHCLPNTDVVNFQVRLRTCDAKTILQFVEKHMVHPKNVPDEVKKHQFAKRIVSYVIRDTSRQYEYTFEDGSKLVWLQEIGKYAIQYPPRVKVVYVPCCLSTYKDQLYTLEKPELDLIAEVEKVKSESEHHYVEHGEF